LNQFRTFPKSNFEIMAMVDAESNGEIRDEMYEELLRISKEHRGGDYVGYDRSIHSVSAIA